jgi:hypothetical protein
MGIDSSSQSQEPELHPNVCFISWVFIASNHANMTVAPILKSPCVYANLKVVMTRWAPPPRTTTLASRWLQHFHYPRTFPSPSTITAPPLTLAVDMASNDADRKLARAPPPVDESWFRVHHLFLIASRELQVWFYMHLFMPTKQTVPGRILIMWLFLQLLMF